MGLLVVSLLAIALARVPGDEEHARALLERAETLAREGHYEDARTAYRKVVRDHPGTDAGRIAERRSLPSAFLGWRDLVRHGPSENRVDVVLMGDGYTLGHQKAFDNLAEDVPGHFERQETFREYWSYFNFLRANLVSADDGVDGFGRLYDTALDARTLPTYAGHVGVDRAKVKEMLAEIPGSDALAIVFVKLGVLGTGGGGVAVIGGMSEPMTIHEWGHAFAGLSDEYDEELAKHQGTPRDGINVSSTEDPKAVPWAHWIAAKHPSVGIYEGAAQRVRGAWRPTASGCVMQNGEFFCPVCQEALVLRIYATVDPIDGCTPSAPPPGIREPIVVRDEAVELSVRVLQPESHELEVRWWILPEAPETRGGPGERTGVPRQQPEPKPADARANSTGARAAPTVHGDRRDRGPLAPMTARPTATTRPKADGTHELRIAPTEFEPGRYKIVCRVRDTTLLRGEKWPWVLKDERGLLESERVWWLRVERRGPERSERNGEQLGR